MYIYATTLNYTINDNEHEIVLLKTNLKPVKFLLQIQSKFTTVLYEYNVIQHLFLNQ